MTAAPRVSVVMPAYNAARTISDAVASVLGQSCADLELIVCDDASTDGTAGIAAAFADERVRVLDQAGNAGPGAARDRAIGAARGEWIAVIDADDAWAPDRLERLLDAAGGDERMVFDDILVCHDAPGSPGGMVPWRRLRGSRAFGNTGTGVRDIPVENYIRDERLLIKPIIPAWRIRQCQLRHSRRRFGEDAEFFLNLAAAGLRLRYLPEPLYHYRVTPGSATAEARDPTLMRECLMQCASAPGFDEAARAAFSYKLQQLQEHEALRLCARALPAFDLRQALGALARQPRSLLRVPRLLARRIGYEIHRIASGGSRR